MGYSGQHGPNVSEYIANLNAIPSAQDLAAQNQDAFTIDDDLAMFTNTQFFDFDVGQGPDLSTGPFTFDGLPENSILDSIVDSKNPDFMSTEDFNFTDFATFSAEPPAFQDLTGAVTATTSPTQDENQHSAAADSMSPGSSGILHAGEKRKADAVSDNQSSVDGFDEFSRVAAEEDKRRRNTAASARFRVKKKQREQALEKSAKEMSDKVAALEGRINQLETENRWLKNLLTEKNGAKEDVTQSQNKHAEIVGERKGDARKDGVGTVEAVAK